MEPYKYAVLELVVYDGNLGVGQLGREVLLFENDQNLQVNIQDIIYDRAKSVFTNEYMQRNLQTINTYRPTNDKVTLKGNDLLQLEIIVDYVNLTELY